MNQQQQSYYEEKINEYEFITYVSPENSSFDAYHDHESVIDMTKRQLFFILLYKKKWQIMHIPYRCQLPLRH